MWPQVGPTDGKKTLPKRPGAAPRTGRASFVHDVLGVLGAEGGRMPGSTAPSRGGRTVRGLRGGPSAPGARPPPTGEGAPRRHEWHWKEGRWLCVSCLATSRLGVPPRLSKCAGMSPDLARLVQDPRKHKLQIATFADGKGMVLVCSRCGHYATSNRPTELHKKVCAATGGQAAFASPGAKSAYERIVLGKHPKHAKGEAKVLDPCMSLEALCKAGQEPHGSTP
jgi:hypothetical protein